MEALEASAVLSVSLNNTNKINKRKLRALSQLVVKFVFLMRPVSFPFIKFCMFFKGAGCICKHDIQTLGVLLKQWL